MCHLDSKLEVPNLLIFDTFRIVSVIATAIQVGHTARATIFEAAISGDVLEYIEPMYRGPSRGPCIGTIYPTLLGFGGIQATILSYPLFYTID